MPEESMMAVFEEIIDNSQNALVSEAMDAGRIPIGYTCSFVPEVLLSVDGLFPLRLRAPGIGGTQLADIYLPPIICSYCRSLLEYGMNGQYDFLGGWVFNHSCQHMNRCSDVVKTVVKPPFVHVLDALHTCTENTISWMVDELQELKEKLSNHFDVSINDDTLKTAIDDHNRVCVGDAGDRRIAKARTSPPDRSRVSKDNDSVPGGAKGLASGASSSRTISRFGSNP